MADADDRPQKSEPSWREVAEGLLYTHARLSENTQATLEAASFLYGLVELLHERELISIEELDQRKREVAKRLARKNSEKGVGVLLQEPEYEKYSFTGGVTIDCENRVALCKAACCRLPFALSKQDIREGIVRWDLGQPYMIAQDETGYCSHLDRDCHRCTIHEHRPVPCRGYDCRRDGRIWLDFDNRTINPEILREDWPRCVSAADMGARDHDSGSG
jgi:Fe-S-cluster containining protein